MPENTKLSNSVNVTSISKHISQHKKGIGRMEGWKSEEVEESKGGRVERETEKEVRSM